MNTFDYYTEAQKSPHGLARVPVQTQETERPEEIDKRRTRYGMIPIWPQKVEAKAFFTWTIPANRIFPFRYFRNEIGYDHTGNELYRSYRATHEQIKDMGLMVPHFLELPELFAFDESTVERIARVIHLPRNCSKYPTELGTGCTTCWLAYLEHDVAGRIDDELRGEERTAAYAVARKVISKLEAALEDARQKLDTALRDLDDPKNAKSKLIPWDLNNAYHLHADRPKHRTIIDSENRMADQISTAFEKIFERLSPQQPEQPQDAAALRAQLAEIQKRLEAFEKKAERQPVKMEIVELGEEEMERRRSAALDADTAKLSDKELKQKRLENLAKAREVKQSKSEATKD